jgi:hypothetical protein
VCLAPWCEEGWVIGGVCGYFGGLDPCGERLGMGAGYGVRLECGIGGFWGLGMMRMG